MLLLLLYFHVSFLAKPLLSLPPNLAGTSFCVFSPLCFSPPSFLPQCFPPCLFSIWTCERVTSSLSKEGILFWRVPLELSALLSLSLSLSLPLPLSLSL